MSPSTYFSFIEDEIVWVVFVDIWLFFIEIWLFLKELLYWG